MRPYGLGNRGDNGARCVGTGVCALLCVRHRDPLYRTGRSRFAMQPLYVPAVALHNIVTSIPQAIGTRLARSVVTEMAVPKRGLW